VSAIAGRDYHMAVFSQHFLGRRYRVSMPMDG
jgi:hypothetical protein